MTAADVVAVLRFTPPLALVLAGLLFVIGAGSLVSAAVVAVKAMLAKRARRDALTEDELTLEDW